MSTEELLRELRAAVQGAIRDGGEPIRHYLDRGEKRARERGLLPGASGVCPLVETLVDYALEELWSDTDRE